ncbi:MAG: (2Fe-2S)-binding protein [Gemmatimonadetes bacterium]|nr:(2Fe-2S)-binding protein [Gemmatimonadota bacterium]
MPKQTFSVNGERRSVDVPDEMPVLWVVRDVLGLTGTKFGCGAELCGACTVLVEGEAIRTCVAPISSVSGKDVVTIEGLSPDGSHPLQQAWRDLNVPQCGYCQAGQIMNAAALLARSPSPTDAQIDQAQQDNLCRCGTYPRIRAAIRLAAEVERTAARAKGGP